MRYFELFVVLAFAAAWESWSWSRAVTTRLLTNLRNRRRSPHLIPRSKMKNTSIDCAGSWEEPAPTGVSVPRRSE